jgi:RHS repeat-associated protein
MWAGSFCVVQIHISATNCSSCGSTNTFAGTQSLTAANAQVIRTGDKLVWRQYQTGVASGGIQLWLNNSFKATANDTDSQPIYADTTMNAWHSRSVDLSSYAGDTLTSMAIWNYTGGSPGSWDIYFADIALLRADGTVIPIYNGTTQTLTTFQGPAISGLSVATEQGTSIMTAANQTTYFGADHLGSTRMEFAGGGWPTWSEDYAPYGQQVTPVQSTQNHYKFTSYERDPETGDDYAQARYYSSPIQGRFSSPDPYDGSMDIANPQTLNRYSYVMNNPLTFTDPTGLDPGCTPGDTIGTAPDGSPIICGTPAILSPACGGGYGYVESGTLYCGVYTGGGGGGGGSGGGGGGSGGGGGGGGGAPGLPLVPTKVPTLRNPNLPNCYAVELDTFLNDMNPFSFGYSSVTSATGEAMNSASAAKATNAAIYAATRINTKGGIGLLQPLKSSTYRGLLTDAKILSKSALVLNIVTVDAAVIHAGYAAWNTPCQVP